MQIAGSIKGNGKDKGRRASVKMVCEFQSDESNEKRRGGGSGLGPGNSRVYCFGIRVRAKPGRDDGDGDCGGLLTCCPRISC